MKTEEKDRYGKQEVNQVITHIIKGFFMDRYTKIFRVLSVILGTLIAILVVMLIVLLVKTGGDLSTKRTDDSLTEQTTLAQTRSDSETEETAQEETESETEEETEEESEESVHTYKITAADCSWTQAYEACLEDGGYLLNINSEEEFDKIINFIESAGYEDMVFLLGGAREEDDESYYWVNEDGEFYGESLNAAESWCSGLWLSGEPSYADGDVEEMVVIMFCIDGQWYFNDAPDDILETVSEYEGMIAYICEYE